MYGTDDITIANAASDAVAEARMAADEADAQAAETWAHPDETDEANDGYEPDNASGM